MARCQINTNICKGCALCVDFCSRDCLEMSEELNVLGYHSPRLVNPNRCTGCGMCADMCPETAIQVYRAKKKPRKK